MNTEERINKLESRVRRQRLGMAITGLGMITLLAMGMNEQAPKKMALEELTILTSEGRPGVIVGTNERMDGRTGQITIFTADGNPGIMIGTNEKDGGYGLGVMDANMKARVILGVDAKDDPGMGVLDSNESPKIMMGSDKDGSGIMLIGATIMELPAPPAAPDKK